MGSIDYFRKISEGILGLAIGDAVGVPLEFTDPQLFKSSPVTKMLEYGSHNQPRGTWSDDTSMSIALIEALSVSGESIDYERIMKNFYHWIKDGEFTAGGDAFDVGKTCFTSIDNFAGGMTPEDCGPKGEYDCGNGALMRCFPIVFRLISRYGSDFENYEGALDEIYKVTSLTHGHPRCKIANLYYILYASELLKGTEKQEAFKIAVERADKVIKGNAELSEYLHDFDSLHNLDFSDAGNVEIRSKMYVVDSLNAALWSFMSSSDYRGCILSAVNLGGDADTVAAISGALAGIYYGIGGEEGIPYEWIDNIMRVEYLVQLCKLYAKSLDSVK